MLTLIVVVLSQKFSLNHQKKLEAFPSMILREIQVLLRNTHLILQIPLKMGMRSPVQRNKKSHHLLHLQSRKILKSHPKSLSYLRESMKGKELDQIQSKRQWDKVQEAQAQNQVQPQAKENQARNLVRNQIRTAAKIQVQAQLQVRDQARVQARVQARAQARVLVQDQVQVQLQNRVKVQVQDQLKALLKLRHPEIKPPHQPQNLM